MPYSIRLQCECVNHTEDVYKYQKIKHYFLQKTPSFHKGLQVALISKVKIIATMCQSEKEWMLRGVSWSSYFSAR